MRRKWMSSQFCAKHEVISHDRTPRKKRDRVELVTQDFALKRAIARHSGSQRLLDNKTRSLTIVLLIVLLSVCGAIAAGLRFNGTRSFPVGFYSVGQKRPQKGDLVIVDLPALPSFYAGKRPRVSQRSLQSDSASPQAPGRHGQR
jgi:hypothetical protein